MKKIKLFVMDVDGTLTDGKIYMGNNGEMFKVFDIKDGCGIHDILPQNDIIPVVITARESTIVMNRCKELGINECYQKCRDKVLAIKEVAQKYGLTANKSDIYEEIAYIGDDLVDIPAMEICGIVGCPENAVSAVKQMANYVSKFAGGFGAVRDFIEWIVDLES